MSPDRPFAQERWKTRLGCVWAWLPSGKVSDAWCFGACYTFLLPFFLAPLFATRLLPGLDLPFHMAAADMLSKVGRAASPYAPYYDGGLRIAPYAAHFVALIGLGKIMGLLAAHKLIIILYVAGLPLAMASLLAVCRRSRIPALLAFPLAYNLTLHYGFISFALSLPVLMLLLAQEVKNLHSQPGQVRRSWLLAAAAALLLLPDGAQQGMRNTFMSYHWLTQISPSATYGLGLLAVAWLFVIRGCAQGNRLQLLAGWLLAGILAVYKLHFFIASALLLWLVPPLFFRVGARGPPQSPPLTFNRSGLPSERCGPALPSRPMA